MKNYKGKFEYSTEGYILAKAWLKDIGKWEQVSTSGFSVDGWSIIYSANVIYEQRERKRFDLIEQVVRKEQLDERSEVGKEKMTDEKM